MCKLGDDHPFLLPDDLVASMSMLSRDHRVDELRELPILELCLVIATSHILSINDFEPFNFEMVYIGKVLSVLYVYFK